jgi:hypothetical protein
MRGFHDWLKRRPSSLFMQPISVVSLIIRSMYLDLIERMLVFYLDSMAQAYVVFRHS